ncbi:killer cell immunoglobulin-like receptor 2DS1 [Bos indicus x Bos taurus]|uniref:killer cell immunoglobulin-like receptor 2DS1 n=1 Tax=Bos indicus x Bos taurus TaxID=30522 RepID=UPI000F7D485F|nr:killer cell immunoglobulin-like receptor 2DS1 [Bos indicus x Bos taurus]
MGFGKRLSHESASPSSRSVQKTLSLSPEGPVVRSGENVTLVCSSESAFNQFHLLREWDELGRLLAGGWGSHGALQAEFPLGPGTPAHSGVYRCYGSFTRSPYSWSDFSDQLFLSVTGSTTRTCPSTMDPHTTEESQLPQGHSSQLHLLLRLSVAFIYTSIFLAVLVCHWLPINGVDRLSNLGHTPAFFGFDVPTKI